MEASLLHDLSKAQVESKVAGSGCIQEILTDVEFSVLLQDRLETEQEVQRLRAQVAERDLALEETRLIRQERVEKERELADGVVKELWSLSQQLGELKNVKKQHQDLLVRYDEVIAKLMQTEDELQIAKEEQERLRNEEQVRSTASVEPQREPESADVHEADTPLRENVAESEPTEETSKPVVEPLATYPDTVASMEGEEAKEESATDEIEKPPAIVSTAEQAAAELPPPAPPAVVVSLEQDAEPETPTLDQLDNKLLFSIFGFLDALDILNVAQINISMYSRVDTLFGLGNDDADNSTIATNETAPSTQPAATVSSLGASTQPTASTGTVVALPPKPAPAATPARPKPVATAVDPQKVKNAVSPINSANEGLRNFFNAVIQPGRGKPPGSRSPARTRAPSVSESAPMSAAIANSMAFKLSDSELNAIIVMSERLRQKEALAETLVKEREDLEAKIEGTENVKKFLIGKVRDLETALTTQQSNEAKVAQQISSDQEVIAFLDGRVQELEQEMAKIRKEQQESSKELARIKEQAEQKGMVMGDMLQFERERWQESEREWKGTKRILIKEVRSCRAQMAALQAERDGYREQNDVLRKALLASPSSKLSLNRDSSS